MAPSSKAGPSNPKIASSNQSRPPPKGLKVINKTVDLLRWNEGPKSKGRGKEREVMGDVISLIQANKTLPGALQVERFAETRALEILAFQNAIKSAAAQGSSRTFQSLPRHLRRRAASHNPRRVPKRLRSRAAAEIQPSDNIAKLHRKRARLRAKGNLRGESRTEQFAKRQRDKIWLSTHIYHAKRFHMQNLWGYRLPITPTLKSFRPAYRAAKRKAVVHDASYFGIIELEGTRDEILSLLGRMTGGGRFAGERYESGGRAARTDLYYIDSYPRNLIGPVEIIWQPSTALNRVVWLRLHPSIYTTTWDAIKVGLQQLPAESGLQLRDLRGDVEAFEIMGPRAGRVLKRVLRLCRSESAAKTVFFDSLARLEPAEVPEGMIVGLRAHDPRLHFPPPTLTDEDIEPESDGVYRSVDIPPPSSELATSALWRSDDREALSKPTFKKSDLDRRRQKLQLPGTRLRPQAKDDRIPLLLIQRSIGQPQNPESIHGFTLLFPSGWSNYLLQSFVFSQCLLIGIAERRVQYREAGIPSFPEHYGAVNKAGAEWEEEIGKEAERRWGMKPPGKRAEYSTLGTGNPFVPDWNVVLNPSSGGESNEEETALNGSSAATKIEPLLLTSPIIDNLEPIIDSQNPPKTLFTIINIFRKQRSLPPSTMQVGDLYNTTVIHVKINVLGRGSPGDTACIYAVDTDERRRWLDALEKDGRIGRAGWEGDLGMSDIQRMGEVKPDPTRTIGYTSSGNFSLARGKGHAIGTVSFKSYINLIRLSRTSGVSHKDQAVVKVRNKDGVICRLATLEAVCTSF